jgi:nucleoside-diphosphate-sugar epimerase
MVGSHLTRLLLEREYEVLGLDDFSGPCSCSNTGGLESHVRACDVAAEGFPPDWEARYVVFCAEGRSASHALETSALPRCLEFARRTRAVFMYVSSDDVYGFSGNRVCAEDGEYPSGAWYSAGAEVTTRKRFAESLVQSYFLRYGLEVRIARVFDLMGSGLHEGHWLGRLRKRIRASDGGRLRMVDGQTVALCPVEYAVEALYRLLRVNYTSPINVGAGARPLEEVVREMEGILGIKTSLRTVSRKFGDVLVGNRIPDLKVARQALGWGGEFSSKILLDSV